MGLVVFHVQVVAIVRRHQRDSRIGRQPDQFAIGLFLLRDAVVLKLEIKVLVPEDVLVVKGRFLGIVVPPLEQKTGDLAGEACRHADKPFAVLSEQFLVDAGFVVKSFEVGLGNELNEVLISLFVPGQKDEVVEAFIVLARRPCFFEAGTGSHVHLAADDRLDPCFGCLQVEIQCGKKVAVVRDRDSRHAKFNSLLYQSIKRVGAVEQAVFGVEVKVDKIGMMHRFKTSTKSKIKFRKSQFQSTK